MVTWCVDIPAVSADHVTGFIAALVLVAGLISAFLFNLPDLLRLSGFWEEDDDEDRGGE